MAMVERLTLFRGVEKILITNENSALGVSKRRGIFASSNARFGNWRLWGIRVSIRFGKFAHSL